MLAIVTQARMTSTRLPGKSLRVLDGERTTVQLHVERLQRVERGDMVVVATSTDPSDDPIAELCERRGVEVVRGPLEDVSRRYVMAIERHGLDTFVRATADSPLIDQALIDYGIGLYGEGGYDIVSNNRPSTYATGQSFEVIDARAYLSAYPDMSEPHHFEHVTPFLYENRDRFRIRNFRHHPDDSAVNVSIDTEEDARLVQAILARMERPHWEYGYDEVMALYRDVTGG
jgi:spore coat polysaccharide biosynthesis protein SpsF